MSHFYDFFTLRAKRRTFEYVWIFTPKFNITSLILLKIQFSAIWARKFKLLKLSIARRARVQMFFKWNETILKIFFIKLCCFVEFFWTAGTMFENHQNKYHMNFYFAILFVSELFQIFEFSVKNDQTNSPMLFFQIFLFLTWTKVRFWL